MKLFETIRTRLAEKTSKDDGFTLVEMVVALGVVLTLSAAGVVAAPAMLASAQKSACLTTASTIDSGLTAWYTGTGVQRYNTATVVNLISSGYLSGATTQYDDFTLTGVAGDLTPTPDTKGTMTVSINTADGVNDCNLVIVAADLGGIAGLYTNGSAGV